jgi:hypothetical protein
MLGTKSQLLFMATKTSEQRCPEQTGQIPVVALML